MGESRMPVLPAGQWRTLDRHTWRAQRDALLGNESGGFEETSAVLADSDPDSFTVAERLNSQPLWLTEAERDGASWLRALVASRVHALPQLDEHTTLGRDAAEHTHHQVMRLLSCGDGTGRPIAESLWNQEIPYVVDRVIACCLFGDARIDPDPMPAAVAWSLRVAASLLSWFHRGHRAADLASLTRYALTAGLLDLDIKGGAAICPPINTTGVRPGRVGAALVAAAAQRPLVVDHLPSLLNVVGAGAARLVWFTDDVIESAVDLLVIQRLTRLNPTLRVVIAPRSRRVDNDATHHDIGELLRHRALRRLAATAQAGRVVVTPHGPALAAPLPSKLHPVLLRELDHADAVMVKGGRNHELLVGSLARPLWTGYVVTREFTESQTGFDGRDAPLLLMHTPAGQRPWWGWRGRAHRRLAVAAERTIPACWTTIADHQRRATATDPDLLYVDLAWLIESWPQMSQDYPNLARTEIRAVADRLAHHTQRARDHDLIHRAHQLTTPGATTP